MSASMNGVKARLKSVKSTMQITKAMELVATSKLRRAKERAENTRPFYDAMQEAIALLLSLPESESSIWTKKRAGKTLFVVMAGDRGLAGGYNANIFRMTAELAKKEDALYLPVGKKAMEHARHHGLPLFMEAPLYLAETGVGDCLAMAEEMTKSYAMGEITRVVFVYTKFRSMLTQTPVWEEVLPLSAEKPEKDAEPLFEGEPEELLSGILQSYIGGIFFAAKSEAEASESAARRTAMNAANKNAGEMIDSLMLQYNRARQAVITQEITEIVSGAEAL